VFYDVAGFEVEVLAIVMKSEAEQWLERVEKRLGERSTAVGGQG
jgi:hypothetical protein